MNNDNIIFMLKTVVELLYGSIKKNCGYTFKCEACESCEDLWKCSRLKVMSDVLDNPM